MIAVLLELVISYIQYLSILIETQDVSFPDSWKSPFNYLSAFNLHFDFLAAYLPGLDDIRLYFTVVSVVGPLSFVIFGLIFLNRKLVVLWYVLFLCGVMAFIAGAFARVIAAVTELPLSAELAEYMMFIGGGVSLLCLIIYVVVRKCVDEKEFRGKKKELESETEKLNKLATFQRFFLSLVFLGFFFTGGFWLTPESTNSTIQVFWTGFTWACLGFATISFTWGLVGLCVSGRKIQWTIGQWAEMAFLRILLIAMSLLYIPIGSGVFLVFNCNDLSCTDGQRLPDPGSSVLRNYTSGSLNSVEQCQPAAFSTQQCPSSLYETLCKANTEYRLEYEVTTQCFAMQTFYWPASALIIIMFVLGAPVLFQQMISRGSDLLLEEFPLMYDLKKKRREDEEMLLQLEGGERANNNNKTEAEVEEETPPTEEERWDRTLSHSKNVAKFLYQPFSRRYRYARLFQLFQKLIIVAATVYVFRSGSFNPSYIALGISLLAHIAASIALVYYQPFLMIFESKIAIAMSVALTIACMLGILLLSGLVVPDWVMLLVIILNGVLPLIALVIGIVLEYSRGKKAGEEEEQRRKAKMLKDVHQLEVDEDHAVLAALAAHKNELEVKKKQEADDRALAQKLADDEHQAHHRHPHPSVAEGEVPEETTSSNSANLEDGNPPHYVVAVDEQPISPLGQAGSGKTPTAPSLPPPMAVAGETQQRHGALDARNAHPNQQGHARSRNPSVSPIPQTILAHDAPRQQPTTNIAIAPAPRDPVLTPPVNNKGGAKYITGDGTILLPTASQKTLKRTKRVQAAEKEVAEQIKQDQLELKELQEDMDLRIDYDIKKMLNRFLMGGGVLGFLALGLCLLGLLIDLDIGDAQLKTQDHVFGGYNRFDNFSQHCCCIPYSNAEGSQKQQLEKWVCENGRTIEKLRVLNMTASTNTTTDGYGVRGLCQTTFNTGCSENSDFALSEDTLTTTSRYGVTCAASSGVSFTELFYV